MPIFEFTCKDCREEFEELVQGARQPVCPSCHSENLEKKLSGFAVGGNGSQSALREPLGPCATCGHPDGPGACAMMG